MLVQDKQYTADDLWEISHQNPDRRYELDEGDVIEMPPTGDEHGVVTNWTAHLITGHVDANDLGEVTAAETGFVLSEKPTIVRAPDMGFITKARLQPMTGNYYPMPPDLALEVVSPNDSADQVHRKIGQYLRAGTKLLWIVYTSERSIDVFYGPGQSMLSCGIDDVLDGYDVLPGFKLPVKMVFKKLRD